MARPQQFDPQRVVEAATQTFWSGSYGTTGTTQLCSATGLSRSSLYNTFASKSGLYCEALDHYNADKDALREEFATRDLDGRAALRALLSEVLAEQAADRDRRVCLVMHAAVDIGTSDEQIAARARAGLDGLRDLIERLVRRGIADGSLRRHDDPAALALALHSMVNGLQVAARVGRDQDDITAAVDAALALL